MNDFTMIVSRIRKDNHVQTLLYEMDMLDYCFEHLNKAKTREGKAFYLLIEGFLLHYRNLIEFFASHGGDLKVKKQDEWSRRILSPAELATLQNDTLCKKYASDISRHLSHCNTIRAEEDISWNLQMYAEIEPLLTNFRNLFPSYATPVTRQPSSPGSRS